MSEHAGLLRRVRLSLAREDYATAAEALNELIQRAEAAGDYEALARHQGNLALVFHRTGQPEPALQYLEAALASARTSGDLALESGLLGNAGNMLREYRRYDDAIAALHRALALAVDVGDERGRGIWLGNLALVYDDQGTHEQAIPLHEQSIIVARALRDLRGLAGRLGNLARSCMAGGDQPSALIHLQEAVMIYRDLNDGPNLARQLATIGSLYVVLGGRTATRPGMLYCYQRAVEHYRQSLTAAYEAGENQMQADILRMLGSVFIYMDQYDEAINHLDMAYQMFSSLGIQEPLADLETALHQLRTARQTLNA